MKGEIFMMMRRQIAVALTGIIAGNTVLFAHAAATTETQSERTADRYMIIDLAGIPFTWTDESLTEIQVSEAASTEFEDFSESSLEAEEPPYYMSLTSLDNEYLAHLDQFDSIENTIDMYTSSQVAYAVSDIRTNEPIIAYLLDQYAGYDTYSAVEFYEVASLKPADENGIYSLLLQQEESVDAVHYSAADGTFQKSAVEAVLNEYGQPSYSLETTTNHWMIVHLIPEVSAEGQDAVQAEEKETDEEASRSLEGALEEDNADPTGSSRKDSQTPDSAAATSEKSSSETKLPEASTTNVPETQKPAQTKPATTKPAQTTKAPETAATVAPTTSTPTTAAHTHTWVPVTTTVHHDAVTSQVWKEDSAAWDETVVTKAAWDEQVLVQAAYDEPVYEWVSVCNVCGYQFPLGTTGDQLEYHIFDDPGCGGGWHGVQVQTGSVHHDAVYQTVHHDAVYNTVHHDAETNVVHHDATGHYETVVTKEAWDEQVTTGYKCSGCGAAK